MAVDSWSHSKYTDFAKCKRMFFLKHDQKIPEPERELRPGQTEHANDRGSRIHDSLEVYVRGLGDFPNEAREFRPEFDHMRHLFGQGRVSLEGEWGMDRNWDIAPWKSAWLRLKLDALVHANKEEAVVIDYKSGRRFGNEMKHGEQTQLYALNTFLRFPELEVVHTELWYLDVKELDHRVFTRDQALRFKRIWNNRGVEITSAQAFPPNANIYSCQYCGYGPWGTGDCPDGVKK